MMNRLILLLAASLLLTGMLTCANAAASDKVMITLCEWKPYTSDEMENGGILTEIARRAFVQAGYEPVFVFLPWQRAKQTFLSGDAQVLLGLFKTQTSQQRYWLSDTLLKTDIVLARLASNPFPFSSLDDVRDKTIGYVRDSGYSGRMKKEGVFIMEEAPHEMHNLQKLLAGRVDVIIDARDTLNRALSIIPAEQREQVVILDPPVKRRTLCAAFPRTEQGKKLQKIFNSGLKNLHKNGEYARILRQNNIIP